MSLSPTEYLKHILLEAEFIINSTKNISEEYFSGDEILKRAIVRSREIIGEATKKLPQDFREQNPHIEWKSIARMRDRLIHEYFGVDYEIVWDVARNKVPALHKEIQQILESSRNK